MMVGGAAGDGVEEEIEEVEGGDEGCTGEIS